MVSFWVAAGYPPAALGSFAWRVWAIHSEGNAMRLGRDLLVAVMALGVALMACKKGEEKSEDKTEEKADDTKAEEKAEGSDKSGGGSADSVGVPACDEFLTKYEKCISSKVPEAARASMKTSLDTMRKSWKQAASNPASKAALEQGCKQSLETTKQATQAYGCEW